MNEVSTTIPGPVRVLLSHPTGNEFFRHLAVGLAGEGLLEGIATCVEGRLPGFARPLLPRGFVREWERRRLPDGLAAVPVWTRRGRELGRLAAGRLGWRALYRRESGPFSLDSVYRDFDGAVARRLERLRLDGRGAVYAYEDGAEASFAAAGRRGWLRAYELPIAYWETRRRLVAEEAERLPAWVQTLTLTGTGDSPAKLERKRRELESADVVVCPSPFVVRSLPEWARKGRRIVMAPFGSPAAAPTRSSASGGGLPGDGLRPAGARLRVLFAGGMTQRKGLADLFAAMRLLGRPDVELVVMGSPVAPPAFYRGQYPDFTYEPPRPHAEVLELMARCDVFCLPSIVEGRALVIQEAMSRGMPAIITPNTGSDDLVVDGQSGWIVPIRSPEALASRIAWFADNRAAIAPMGEAARAAAARLTWAGYAGTIARALVAGREPS